MGFFWCNSGTSLLDIGSQSSFNEATTTAHLCFFRELWNSFCNPNTDWVLLFCPLSGICRSGGGETLCFSTWRWPVWWGWRDWEAPKAVLLQLLVVPDHRRQHNCTHIACLCGRSCELWVGLWNSHCWSCNCHSRFPFWNSLVQTPACDPRKPSYTSSPSSDCCSSQFQSGSTHWSITASWDRYAEADQEESEEETPSPHWFLKVKKIVATSFINIGLMCFSCGLPCILVTCFLLLKPLLGVFVYTFMNSQSSGQSVQFWKCQNLGVIPTLNAGFLTRHPLHATGKKRINNQITPQKYHQTLREEVVVVHCQMSAPASLVHGVFAPLRKWRKWSYLSGWCRSGYSLSCFWLRFPSHPVSSCRQEQQWTCQWVLISRSLLQVWK